MQGDRLGIELLFNKAELLQEKRMNQARYLLAHTKLSVNQIIALVGYENNSYFYRKFREKYGETPKDYREREKRI